MSVSKLIKIVGLTTCISAILSAPSLAQDVGSAPSTSTDGSAAGQQIGGLQEIVVTAQRKSERLQDVPIAVTAISGTQLAANGVSGMDSLTTAVAGLQVTAVGEKNTPFLRGVGSTCGTPNCEASVATYVDGVYQASTSANVLDYNNVERIEVLKGPQGTLFGRNSTGGVIQIVTRDPVHDPMLEAQLGLDNYQTLKLAAYMSAGLTENVAADLSVQYTDQNDGWGKNIITGEDVFRYDEFSARTKLLFTPSDRTRILVSADFAKRDSNFSSFQIEAPNIGLDGVSHRPGRFDVDSNFDAIGKVKSWGGSLRVEHDLGFAQLVSITARRLNKIQEGQDVDSGPIDLLHFIHDTRVNQTTQEFQLISQGNSRFEWTIGAYYYNGLAHYNPISLFGVLVGGGPVDTFGLQKTWSYAGYAQGTYNITDTTRLTGGIRYTHERQTFVGSDPFTSVSDEKTFNKPTWRIALDQKLSRDMMVYASYNRGLKSGGFSLGNLSVPGFTPEIIDAYEIGFKSEFLDRRVRFNVAAFYYDFKDLQVEVFANDGSLIGFIQNAAKSRLKGIDADLQVVPMEGLTLRIGAGYLDGEYLDYPNPAVFGSSPFVPVVLPNAKGFATVRSPKFSGNASATYDWTTGAGSFSATANVSYSDHYFFDPASLFRQDKYAIVGASMTWWSPSEQFGVRVWGKNLTDTDYIAGAAPGGFGLLQSPAAPRTYGLTLMTKM